jgi:hypothetical protein
MTEVLKTSRPRKGRPGAATGWSGVVVLDKHDRSGWNEFVGSRFCLEFRNQDVVRLGQRLQWLTSEAERAAIAEVERHVVLRTPMPPEPYFLAITDPIYRRNERELFVPLPAGAVYPSHHDIWCRYRTDEDIDEWRSLLASLLPNVWLRLERATSNGSRVTVNTELLASDAPDATH